MDARPLADVPVGDLLARYAAILAELRERGVVRTANAPLGDYAEHLAHGVYGGSIEANSKKSYDIESADGRLIQVKARTLAPGTSPSAVFSAFRSFDFDVATFLAFDASSYDLLWACELSPADVEAAARWSKHVNGFLLRIPLAQRLGRDVTALFSAELARG